MSRTQPMADPNADGCAELFVDGQLIQLNAIVMPKYHHNRPRLVERLPLFTLSDRLAGDRTRRNAMRAGWVLSYVFNGGGSDRKRGHKPQARQGPPQAPGGAVIKPPRTRPARP